MDLCDLNLYERFSMKVSEIPEKIFFEFTVGTLAYALPDHYLNGTRTIAPLSLDGYAVFANHPELNCSSCGIFTELGHALKGIFPTCSVQVGPHQTHWDDELRACHQKLMVSFTIRHPSPPLVGVEESWVQKIQERLTVLEKTAEPVKFTDLAMDLVE